MIKRIAILGCGYVGTALARHWHSQHQLTVTTTTPAKVAQLTPIAQQVLVLQGQDQAALRSLLQDQEVLVLCMGAKGQHTYASTYLETAKTVAAVLQENCVLEQIIYTSSYALYGDHGGAWVTEDLPIQPNNPKATVLAQTEQTLLALNISSGAGIPRSSSEHSGGSTTQVTHRPDRKVCIFRLAGIYGPDRSLDRLFRPLAGTIQPGEGSEASNWIHLDDIVGAIDFAQRQQLSGVYNLVNDEPLARRELLQRLCQHYHLDPVQWDASQPSSRTLNVRLSNQKLKAAGYQFIHPMLSLGKESNQLC